MAWSPVTAGWRSRDEPGGGVAVDSLAPSLTLVLPIGDDTVGNTQIHRNGWPDRSISRKLAWPPGTGDVALLRRGTVWQEGLALANLGRAQVVQILRQQ